VLGLKKKGETMGRLFFLLYKFYLLFPVKKPELVSSFPMQKSVDSLAFMRCHVMATNSASPSGAVGLVCLYFIYSLEIPCSYKL